MNPFALNCPSCGAKLQVRSGLALAKCDYCGGSISLGATQLGDTYHDVLDLLDLARDAMACEQPMDAIEYCDKALALKEDEFDAWWIKSTALSQLRPSVGSPQLRLLGHCINMAVTSASEPRKATIISEGAALLRGAAYEYCCATREAAEIHERVDAIAVHAAGLIEVIRGCNSSSLGDPDPWHLELLIDICESALAGTLGSTKPQPDRDKPRKMIPGDRRVVFRLPDNEQHEIIKIHGTISERLRQHEAKASGTMAVIERPTSWPETIGMISMVWAGIGLSCAGCGLMSVMMELNTSVWVLEMQGHKLLGMALTLAIKLQIGVGIVLSVILFAAGFATRQRLIAGRLLHLVWSGISLLWTPVSIVMIFQQDAAMKRWLTLNPSDIMAKQPGAGINIGLMIGLTLTLAFSLFIFVWFMFIKKTKESFGPEPVKDYI
ncbi:MAG: hypothetical protein K2Y21_12940 [Phycisphaerales bacterium]|nr:hypothetical protein [Phycisphaerales bacterium]